VAYQPPVFNLVANIWACTWPEDADPDYTDVPCQKYIRSRMSLDASPQAADGFWRVYTPPIQLRFPRQHTAFTGPPALWPYNCFEVPAGSGQYYRAYWQEVQHQGFPNEYAIILVNPCTAAGLAIGPPLAEFGLGTTPDICPAPPPDVEQLVQCNCWVLDDQSTGATGVTANIQDEDNFYACVYDLGSNSFDIWKCVGGSLTSLVNHVPAASPDVDASIFIQFTLLGSSLTGHFVHPNDEATITITDTTFPMGTQCGMILQFQRNNAFQAYLDLVQVCDDNFLDTTGTNLSAHTMDMGSGWGYGTTGSGMEIDGSTPTMCIMDPLASWSSPFNRAFTDYP